MHGVYKPILRTASFSDVSDEQSFLSFSSMGTSTVPRSDAAAAAAVTVQYGSTSSLPKDPVPVRTRLAKHRAAMSSSSITASNLRGSGAETQSVQSLPSTRSDAHLSTLPDDLSPSISVCRVPAQPSVGHLPTSPDNPLPEALGPSGRSSRLKPSEIEDNSISKGLQPVFERLLLNNERRRVERDALVKEMDVRKGGPKPEDFEVLHHLNEQIEQSERRLARLRKLRASAGPAPEKSGPEPARITSASTKERIKSLLSKHKEAAATRASANDKGDKGTDHGNDKGNDKGSRLSEKTEKPR